MKKILSVTLIIATLLCVCVFFTGCTALEEERVKSMALEATEEHIEELLDELSYKSYDDYTVKVKKVEKTEEFGPTIPSYTVTLNATLYDDNNNASMNLKCLCTIMVYFGNPKVVDVVAIPSF